MAQGYAVRTGNMRGVLKRGKTRFGLFFIPVSVYNACCFKVMLAI